MDLEQGCHLCDVLSDLFFVDVRVLIVQGCLFKAHLLHLFVEVPHQQLDCLGGLDYRLICAEEGCSDGNQSPEKATSGQQHHYN